MWQYPLVLQASSVGSHSGYKIGKLGGLPPDLPRGQCCGASTKCGGRPQVKLALDGYQVLVLEALEAHILSLLETLICSFHVLIHFRYQMIQVMQTQLSKIPIISPSPSDKLLKEVSMKCWHKV